MQHLLKDLIRFIGAGLLPVIFFWPLCCAPALAQGTAQVTGISPAALVPGVPNTITVQGSGLSGVTAITVNGVSTPFALSSPTQLNFIVTPLPWATANVQLAATVNGASVSTSLPMQPAKVPYDTAVRFLQQAGFGPTPLGVAQVQQLGLSGWIDWQMQVPGFNYTGGDPSALQYFRNTQQPALALRQRVGLALEQVFVLANSNLCNPTYCGPLWESLIENDAFLNIQTLLKDVSLSPMMGAFLNNGNNYAGVNGTLPNQNWAREVMQLMTIGTVKLNLDGSQVLDGSGQPVPTYTQDNVAAMALALSGYSYPVNGIFSLQNLFLPMTMSETKHDHSAKTILPGVTLPAGQTGYQDSVSVQSALIAHPNMAPFISRRLIQHLVKSKPSPAYMTRISKVFLNDGTGVSGNLAAVVKAILLDPEARAGDNQTTPPDSTAGHFMEPVLYIAMVSNAVGAVFTDGQVNTAAAGMGQQQYFQPSVFSFYSPNHVLADGTPAPETQLMDNAHAVQKMGNIYNLLHPLTTNLPGFALDPSQSIFWNATSPADLLDRINHVFYHGAMPANVSLVLTNFMANDPRSLNNKLGDVLFLAVVNTSYQTIN